MNYTASAAFGALFLSACGTPAARSPEQMFVAFNSAVTGCMAALAARDQQFENLWASSTTITDEQNFVIAQHIAKSCSRSSAELQVLEPIEGTERYFEQCRNHIEELSGLIDRQAELASRSVDDQSSTMSSSAIREADSLKASIRPLAFDLESCSPAFNGITYRPAMRFQPRR